MDDIRREYEIALGRFLLSFNQLDDRLLRLINLVFSSLDRTDLIKLKQSPTSGMRFSAKLYVIELLKCTTLGQRLSNISVADLRALAKQRNILAHAHMDRNPFDDSYRLIERGDTSDYVFTADNINALTAKSETLCASLKEAEAFYEFTNSGS
ncbi:MAG: hypothetical protein ABL962_08230 [Fimbriimonadaceae bacterium]